MNWILGKKFVYVIHLSLVFCLISCSVPIRFRSADDEASLPEVASTSFQKSDAETSFNASPIEDINCTYIVAPYGDDSKPGSEEQPWGSFQGAAALAKPGDTICFRDGTYQMVDTHLSKSGDADALITFAAYPGETPILDGYKSANELLVLETAVTHLRISGFALRNFRIWGILLSGENRYIFLDHLDIEGGEAGIRFTYAASAEEPPQEGIVEYVLLENSLIHGSQYSAVDCTPGPCNHMIIRQVEVYNTGLTGESFYGSDGIEFARGGDILVEDCYVHDNGGDGIDLGSRDREGDVQGVIVRRNKVVRNHLNGIKVWAGGKIENNIIWGSGDSAIWSGSFDCDIEIINNSVAYNLWDTAYSGRNWAVAVGYPEEMPNPSVNLTLVNNIFAFNADPLEGGPTGVYLGPGVQLVEEGHNIYFSNSQEEITVDIGEGMGFSRDDIIGGVWAAYSGKGVGNLGLDPLFLSGWPDVNLKLLNGSPAIDAGLIDFAPSVDFESAVRDNAPDIGADEASGY